MTKAYPPPENFTRSKIIDKRIEAAFLRNETCAVHLALPSLHYPTLRTFPAPSVGMNNISEMGTEGSKVAVIVVGCDGTWSPHAVQDVFGGRGMRERIGRRRWDLKTTLLIIGVLESNRSA